MVDIPGDSTTTRSITVGGSISDAIEVVNDRDWFRITLTAGQSITVSVDGVTLEDPYLRIRDTNGNVIYENDDISSGVNRDSLLAFTATYSGVFYIEVGAWEPTTPPADYTGTGTYTVSVSTYTPPPIGSNDQFADQLINGYWGGNDRHFNVTAGGNITVNLSGLTTAGANLARAALDLWSDVIGVTFTTVAGAAQITFDDNGEGAFAQSVTSNGLISSSTVNVSTQWLTDYGTTFNGYAYQAYIHEVGHALGLGHAGNYNDTARYPFDARYENDSWAVSIMSYFDPQENTYFAGQGFTVERIVTPMVADILAMSLMYGLSTNTRLGDTTYGFNSNAGRSIYDAGQFPNVAYTVFDSGGIDTLDYSGFTGNQVINLNPEIFGSFGNGNVGNLVIARGVVIENAEGGSGADIITGNSVDNVLRGNGGNDVLMGGAGIDRLIGGAGSDTLTGGHGADRFEDSISGLNGDTITDFGFGDRIIFVNATLPSFTFSLSGTTLTYSGGVLTLYGGQAGTLAATSTAEGTVQLMFSSSSPGGMVGDGRADFNGDGRDDVLWRHANGDVTNWLGQANGSFAGNLANSHLAVISTWQITGVGDFNGDGRDDVLWRNSSGEVSNWLGQVNGGFADNFANSYVEVSNSWQVAGVGDFNGDGRDDVLWRNANGDVTNWLGQSNGGFVGNYASSYNAVPNSWQVVGVGDFNGDGRDDVLWRNVNGDVLNWLGQANGSFVGNGSSYNALPVSWHVAGVGDFNGDGRDDVLWRNSNGDVTNWLGQANGGFAGNAATSYNAVSTNWQIAGVGDYNGDGRDDVLWRHANGDVTNWLGQANGSFAGNLANSYNAVSNNWHIQSPEGFI